VISDDQGRRVCTARLTCLLSDRVPGHEGRPGGIAGMAAPAGGGGSAGRGTG